jgi:hypothetical protein
MNNFGNFKEFIWDNAVRDEGNNRTEFKKLNIIYGRNYSGKTTLSRVFRAIQVQKLPNNYSNINFKVYTDIGEITYQSLDKNKYDIRVYNQDFIKENLSFLTDNEKGEVRTFAIVGERNNEIEKEIEEIENKLGDMNSFGELYELEKNRTEKDKCKKNHEEANNSLENKLREHARKIKESKSGYQDINYNITKIKTDIELIKKSNFKPLEESEFEVKKKLLNQEPLRELSKLKTNLKLKQFISQSQELLQRKITPTKEIQELLNDQYLQQWVKQGIQFHRNKRDTCAFCNQPLPTDLWKRLDLHFNEESTKIESDINELIPLIEKEINGLSDILNMSKDSFYSDEQAYFEEQRIILEENIVIYKEDLENLKHTLLSRKNEIFKIFDLPAIKSDCSIIDSTISNINNIISINNGKTEKLEDDKREAIDKLRLSDVASFLTTINYEGEVGRINDLKNALEKADEEYRRKEKEVKELEGRISGLNTQLTDETKGAEKVNSLLNHFFGHNSLKLDAVDNNGQKCFQIKRGNEAAYNLSEGECSLIAFCYFMAKLEDAESKGKKLIIYIDDPISSLDSNHIFFIYSLIESMITKPQKYKQLFVSTHNLDFLKYLKRITLPPKFKDQNGGKMQDYQHFLIERDEERSTISIMPNYLKNYVTEFNYLFNKIYTCAFSTCTDENHDAFYSFGNNLRKFLEAYLFFKYPCSDDQDSKIDKFFGEDAVSRNLANRVINEFSHLGEIIERSTVPVDIPEIKRLAEKILNKIKEIDPEQYDALLRSIGKADK